MRNSWGNPSSEHYASVAARRVLERARNAVAALLIGVDPDDVILTSGGTESSNAVLASAGADATVVVSAVEHSASSAPAELAVRRGAKLLVVPVGADGLADPEAFRRAAVESTSARLFVSIQWANGETGVIQPVHEIASAVHESRPDAVLHVDAAQAVGRIPTPVPPEGGMTALSFSGHKLHGPQGTGVLAFSGRGGNPIAALIVGGGQQRNRRSGTQNVAGAAGLAAALEDRTSDLARRWRACACCEMTSSLVLSTSCRKRGLTVATLRGFRILRTCSFEASMACRWCPGSTRKGFVARRGLLVRREAPNLLTFFAR